MTLIINQVQFAYDNMPFNFSLSLEHGEGLGIMGASGSGKSTLLHLIAGFCTSSIGTIEIDGVDVTHLPPGERPVAMLFQEHNLFPHLTIFENIALGIRGSVRLQIGDQQKIEEAARKVGMLEYLRRYPNDLSGGQKQRVALARILVRKRSVLLLDEPISALDSTARLEMLSLLREAHQEQQFILIMVSHSLEDCLALCTKVATVAEGTIIETKNVRDAKLVAE